ALAVSETCAEGRACAELRREAWMKRALLAALAACALTACASPAPQSEERPSGWSDRSYYLEMRDGVRLALSLYFPGGETPAEPAPVILIQTRYGRAIESLRGGAPRDIDY